MSTTNKYQTSIDLLNKAVGSEIAVSMQYMYFHVHCADRGYEYLAKMFHRISIAEMKHIEELSERILFLEGDVDMNPAYRTKPVHDVKGMLELSCQLEQKTIDDYNAWSKACSEAKDAISHRMFQNLVGEEEQHYDRFRTELDNMNDYGENYLALQAVADSKAYAKHGDEKDND